MWFSYEGEGMNWHELSVDRVNEIVALNKKGKKATSLEEYMDLKEIDDKALFNNVVGQDSLTRFDQPRKKRHKKRKKNRPRNNRNKNQKKNA